MYSEEIDLAMRYAGRGWECWQVPAASITHLGGRSTGQMPREMFVELWRSRLHIYDKYYSRPARVALRLVLALAMLRDICLASLGSGRSKSEADSQRTQRAKEVLRLALQR
jgi:GT2 family glycosyltransferase